MIFKCFKLHSEQADLEMKLCTNKTVQNGTADR